MFGICRRRCARFGIFLFIWAALIVVGSLAGCVRNPPPESAPVESIERRSVEEPPPEKAGLPSEPGPPAPVSGCSGPELISRNNKVVCLSCHHWQKPGSAEKIHRKHRDMSCCECHPSARK